ncbi:hypothetical protein EI200_03660 [Peribacillus simplex]|uniref:hypothetical protein n=1 Tax=Peribacillus simplex TaxID=1478 RepID=UPI000F63966B|nr:hypothetical protein [Peribacillus simplex]RRN73802.1 hypothetical protein EI200_03660 [Peribacillus simplex]
MHMTAVQNGIGVSTRVNISNIFGAGKMVKIDEVSFKNPPFNPGNGFQFSSEKCFREHNEHN